MSKQPEWHFCKSQSIGDSVLFIRTILLSETQEDFAQRLLLPSRKNVASIEKESNIKSLKTDDLLSLELFLNDNLTSGRSVGATRIRELYKQVYAERQRRIAMRKSTPIGVTNCNRETSSHEATQSATAKSIRNIRKSNKKSVIPLETVSVTKD